MGVVSSGHSIDRHANRIPAASYLGQAILMSKSIEVLRLSGAKMHGRGNFFALMFLVLGLGSFVVYFVVGWSSNAVAQV